MPRIPDHPCSEPRCPKLVPRGKKYCPDHAPLHPETVRSATQRGYGSAWQRESKRFLKMHPLCEEYGVWEYVWEWPSERYPDNYRIQAPEGLIQTEYYSRFVKGLWIVPDASAKDVAVAAIAASKARFEFGETPTSIEIIDHKTGEIEYKDL